METPKDRRKRDQMAGSAGVLSLPTTGAAAHVSNIKPAEQESR